jgi:hypothetical protein
MKCVGQYQRCPRTTLVVAVRGKKKRFFDHCPHFLKPSSIQETQGKPRGTRWSGGALSHCSCHGICAFETANSLIWRSAIEGQDSFRKH